MSTYGYSDYRRIQILLHSLHFHTFAKHYFSQQMDALNLAHGTLHRPTTAQPPHVQVQFRCKFVHTVSGQHPSNTKTPPAMVPDAR